MTVSYKAKRVWQTRMNLCVLRVLLLLDVNFFCRLVVCMRYQSLSKTKSCDVLIKQIIADAKLAQYKLRKMLCEVSPLRMSKTIISFKNK